MIDQLPALLPDPVRADRTRARCHKKLLKRTRPKPRTAPVAERAIFLGFGAVYLSSIAFDVLRILLR